MVQSQKVSPALCSLIVSGLGGPVLAMAALYSLYKQLSRLYTSSYFCFLLLLTPTPTFTVIVTSFMLP
ncbi:hypothetical protein CC80DRAFT_489865 [Byssothecium circinans]|uniref:Uncharacterized protein n=1 Tax=Byssothecium circinans TaxID=147558 RepID=A0A6A5UA88_9PLEO|nr:hypothetical protein CC80DRAFT_489865 [Byssothecium circinans]